MTVPKYLIDMARDIRARVIETSHRAGVPHLGSCLSCVDILVACYFHVLRIDPLDPNDSRRDRFILSKGHAAPALFQVLAKRGFFAEAMLSHYGEDGTFFGEHPPVPGHLPGVEAATGSLGHGLSIGLGLALASRINELNYRTICLLSDGECNEGAVWEAAMLAASQKVGSLTAIVDFNKWQATGRSQDVMHLDPLADKWRSFGWDCVEIDGHDQAQIIHALSSERGMRDRPLAIVAHTLKGKGVSFMEDDNNWHYRIPDAEELSAAMRELYCHDQVIEGADA